MFPIRIPKRHTTLPIAAVVLALVCAPLETGTAGIITATATAGPGLPSLLDASGVAVPTGGNEVQVGFFSSGFDFQSTNPAPSLSDLQDNWTSFGSLGVQSIFGEEGRFSGDLVGDDAGFSNEQIHIFALYTNDGKAPKAQWQNVTDYGIFTNTAWTFPDSNSGTPFTMVSTSDVTTMSGGIQLTGVPEPSTAGVCGVILGTSILFARRRLPRRGGPTPTHRMPSP